MMLNKIKYSLFAVLVVLSACHNHDDPKEQKSPYATQYTQGWASFYGRYYNAHNENVVSLDLYSKTAQIDSTGKVSGSGSNIYLSDIFIQATDTFLPQTSFSCDSIIRINTFLKGKDFEGNPTGAYVMRFDESSYTYTLITKGTFVVSEKEDSCIIDFELILADKTKLNAQYRGILPTYDKRK